MLIKIFEGGVPTVIEAPAGSKVCYSDSPDCPDMLQVPGGPGHEDVLLSEAVAIYAARHGLYRLRVVEHAPAAS
jgi:hypothetical protein